MKASVPASLVSAALPALPAASQLPVRGTRTVGDGLALPHERDESLGSTAPSPDPVMQQAARDIAAGLVDTDMHGTPGMDHVQREKLLAEERKTSGKR